VSIKLRKDASHRKDVKIKVVPTYWFSIHLYIEPDLQGHTTVNSQVHTDSTKPGALFSEVPLNSALDERERVRILKSLFIPVGLI